MDLNELKTLEQRVGYILSEFPETHDDEKKLWFAYANVFLKLNNALSAEAMHKFREIFFDKKMPKFGTLGRIKRRLLNKK